MKTKIKILLLLISFILVNPKFSFAEDGVLSSNPSTSDTSVNPFEIEENATKSNDNPLENKNNEITKPDDVPIETIKKTDTSSNPTKIESESNNMNETSSDIQESESNVMNETSSDVQESESNVMNETNSDIQESESTGIKTESNVTNENIINKTTENTSIDTTNENKNVSQTSDNKLTGILKYVKNDGEFTFIYSLNIGNDREITINTTRNLKMYENKNVTIEIQGTLKDFKITSIYPTENSTKNNNTETFHKAALAQTGQNLWVTILITFATFIIFTYKRGLKILLAK